MPGRGVTLSLPIPARPPGLPMRGCPHERSPGGSAFRRFLATAIGIALLVGSYRVLSGPAPAFPLEPAFELAPDVRLEPVPLRWAGGWVLAKTTINGADAGWFKIATGWAFSRIDPKVAARLRLPVVSERGLMGRVVEGSAFTSKCFRVELLQCGAAGVTDVHLTPCDLAEMSQESVRMYGEGISGVLGWDLLKTMPFVLDEPGLQLEWQREATPAPGATRVPVLEKYGCPFIEVTAGTGCKVLAMLNTAAASVSIQMPFLRKRADQLWRGPVQTNSVILYRTNDDDDGLPVGSVVESLPSSRWLAVECGGLEQMLCAVVDPRADPSFGEVQVGYSLLRRVRVLLDGPGKALWLTPATPTPEVELVRRGRPPPSPYLLQSAFRVAIDSNDPVAVAALAAAGADVKGPADVLPLARACAAGAREAALALLEAGASADPDPAGQVPQTPLVSACSNGDPVLIKVLLEKGAEPNRGTRRGFTPLMAAAQIGGPAAVAALRGKARFPIDPLIAARILGDASMGGDLLLAKEMLAQIPEKMQPNVPWPVILEAALLVGRDEMVDWLLATGGPGLASKDAELQPLLAAILPTRVEKTDAIREALVTKLLAAGADPNISCKGVTPLLLAARHGNGAIVKALLAAGAKTAVKDFKGRGPLPRAAAANQPLDVIVPLLGTGPDLNEADTNTDRTILGTYAWHGNLEVCAALLSAGANPDAKSAFGTTPLVLATNGELSSDEDAMAVVNLLLKHGAKAAANSTTDPGLLFSAIAGGRSTLIKPLVEAGALVNKEMFSKVTPLALAAAVSTTETVQALLHLGADAKVLDVMGISPLAHAAAAGKTGSMALLLAHGASPDASSPDAKPPIWVAASVGQLRAVRALLISGANPDARNPETKTTALEVARSRGDQALVTLLESHPRQK